jgi:uncharacterized protein DUF5655
MDTWQQMRERIHVQLARQTGADASDWNKRIVTAGISDEEGLRGWLTQQGVVGYPRMLLMWETFGYPEFLLASADELVAAQYADRPDLLPILDAVLASATGLSDTRVQARKTYVSLLTSRRTFAALKATTKRRVDLGLRLDGVEPHGLLKSAAGVGSDAINVRISLQSVDDITETVLAWLQRAHEENR